LEILFKGYDILPNEEILVCKIQQLVALMLHPLAVWFNKPRAGQNNPPSNPAMQPHLTCMKRARVMPLGLGKNEFAKTNGKQD